MDTAPANGAAVRVYRVTPLDAPLVDFTDGATLVAADLDTNSRQSIYTQQELSDSQTEGLANVIPNGDKGDITTSVGGTVWTIDAGAVVEAKIGTGAVTSAKIADGTIVNADVNASAAIAGTKLAFTPAGGVAATTVQAAIEELDTEKAPIASPTFTGTPAAPTATAGTNTTQLATTAFVATAVNAIASVPSGSVSWFAGSTAPSGYLSCDGSAISRTTYATLFAAISTTHGAGNGSTTFNIPDLRGEFIRGVDGGRGVDSGRAFASAQSGAIGSHSHLIDLYNAGGGAYQAQQQGSNSFTGTTSTGATGGTETRPRNIALLPIIKY
jgi:microcystin-dependent protein